MTIRTDLLQYLQYVHNTGGCSVAQFDEDWEPIGPMVRAEIMPKYVVEDMTDKKLMLTPEGEAARMGIGYAH